MTDGRRPRVREARPGRCTRRPDRVPLAAALALAAGAAGCDFEAGARAAVGSPAPRYEALALDGTRVSLEHYRGEVVLFNIWATWCPPCRKEIPELQALHEAYAARGLRVVGVSVDAGGAEPAVRQFMDEFGMSYDVLRDPYDNATGLFGFPGIPGTVLIGRDGTVLWRHLGPVTARDPGLLAALESAL